MISDRSGSYNGENMLNVLVHPLPPTTATATMTTTAAATSFSEKQRRYILYETVSPLFTQQRRHLYNSSHHAHCTRIITSTCVNLEWPHTLTQFAKTHGSHRTHRRKPRQYEITAFHLQHGLFCRFSWSADFDDRIKEEARNMSYCPKMHEIF